MHDLRRTVRWRTLRATTTAETQSSVKKIVVVAQFQKRHGSRARRRNKSWKR